MSKVFNIEIKLIVDVDNTDEEIVNAVYERPDGYFTIIDTFDGVIWEGFTFFEDEKITKKAARLFKEKFG